MINHKSKIEYTTSQSRTSRWLAPYKICKIILWQCHFKSTHTNDFTSEEIFVYNQEKDDIVEHLFLLRILIKFFIREGKKYNLKRLKKNRVGLPKIFIVCDMVKYLRKCLSLVYEYNQEKGDIEAQLFLLVRAIKTCCKIVSHLMPTMLKYEKCSPLLELEF